MPKSLAKKRSRIIISDDEDEQISRGPSRIDSSSDGAEQQATSPKKQKRRKRRRSDDSILTLDDDDDSDEVDFNANRSKRGVAKIRLTPRRVGPSATQKLFRYQGTYYRDRYGGDREDADDDEEEEKLDDFIVDDDEEVTESEGTSSVEDEVQENEDEDELNASNVGEEDGEDEEDRRKKLPVKELTSTAAMKELSEPVAHWSFPEELVLRVDGCEDNCKANEYGYPPDVKLQFFKASLTNDDDVFVELQSWWDNQKRIENRLKLNGVYIFRHCQVFPLDVFPLASHRLKHYNSGTEPIILSFGEVPNLGDDKLARRSEFEECRLPNESE